MHCVCVLFPPHEWPAGHAEHIVRVALSPPDVNDPPPHTTHAAAPARLYRVTCAHGVHSLALPNAWEPGVHCVCVLLPSHEWPDGQAEHAVRVVALPPVENDPTSQDLHEVALAVLYNLSSPHTAQTLDPVFKAW